MARHPVIRIFCLVSAFAVLVTSQAGAIGVSQAKLLADDQPVSLIGMVAASDKNDFVRPQPQFAASAQVGTVQQAAVNEASGLAASRKNANVLWVHNDSGDTPRVFAMSASGTHLGIYNLQGATATDWEDMAIGPGPISGKDYLFLGDIGDNGATRSTISVYRVEEPVVTSNQSPVTVNLTGWQRITLRYQDGPRDAESLLIDPRSGDLYIISKREAKSRVYRAPASSLVPGTTVTMTFMAELPWGWATAADVSPQGDEVIARGYSNASAWKRAPGSQLWQAFSGTAYTVPLASEPQGEAIAYDAAGQNYYTTSEGVHQPIYKYSRLPGPGPSCFYIGEPVTRAGVRVARAPSGVTGLTRGSVVNVQGSMSTTSAGERQVANAGAQVIGDPSTVDPLSANTRWLGGKNLGAPPLGQWGATDGHGLNTVGALLTVCGLVTSVDYPSDRIELSDGWDRTLKLDSSALRWLLANGDRLCVTGLLSLTVSGPQRLPLLTPRSDADVTRL